MLFRKSIEPSCLYCVHGCLVNDTELFCERKGVIAEPDTAACRRFSYDPLKRVPSRPAVLDTSRMTPEDFQL